METIIVYPTNKEQMAAFKAVAKALQIDFEVQKNPMTRNLLLK